MVIRNENLHNYQYFAKDWLLLDIVLDIGELHCYYQLAFASIIYCILYKKNLEFNNGQ